MRLILLISLFITQNLYSQMDSTSYSIGLILAKNLKAQGVQSIEMDAFNQAISDVFEGNELKIDIQEASNLFRAHLEKASEAMNAVYKEAGEKFLADNAQRPEVVALSSGLQYEILSKSDNENKPTLNDKVKVHYHGTLVDGTVFDSSVERGEPISFPLNGVIQGWQEGLQLMSVGSKYRLFIPYTLAYGARGAGEVIKPYSALIFDVELLAIE